MKGFIHDIVHTNNILYYLHRDGLVLEVDALQQSSSKLNEDRIFELKQRLEDLLMENDTLSEEGQRLKREVKSLRYEAVTMVDSAVCCIYKCRKIGG